jgi:hypothetical protein
MLLAGMQGGLDVVEQVVEHRVFRPQNIGDFHGACGLKIK